MKTYRVRTSCEVARVWREAGTTLKLSDVQAKYLAPPNGDVLELVVDAEKENPDGGFDRDRRSDRKTA